LEAYRRERRDAKERREEGTWRIAGARSEIEEKDEV